MRVIDSAKRATVNKLIDYFVSDPQTNIKKAVDALDTFLPSALFAWIFTYMPVGNDASPELLLRPDQRKQAEHV